MSRVFGSLFYDRQVTAYLRSMRGTETGQTLHRAIVALQFKENPSEGLEAVTERPDRYIMERVNHRITVEVRKERQAIGIILTERLA